MIDRDDINKRFGSRLKQCRMRSGLSQEKLAEAIDLTRTSITNIEHGRQPIQLPTLYAIADALGIEPTDLMPALPHLAGEAPVDREHLKTLSVKTTNWLAKVSGDLPVKQAEVIDGSKS